MRGAKMNGMLDTLKCREDDAEKVKCLERIGFTWDRAGCFQRCAIDLRDSLEISFTEIRDTSLAELKRRYPA